MEIKRISRRGLLGSVFFTIFLDFINLGFIFPIFTSLIFEENAILYAGSSEVLKNAVYAALVAIFPLGQFIGSPFFGTFSDRHGRRPTLVLSLIGTCLGLIICSLAIFTSQVN